MRRIIQKLAAVALSGVLAIVLLLARATVATAKNWNDGTAAWSPGTWSPAGVPVGGEAVNIAFTDGTPRTVTLNVSPPSLGLLTVDLTVLARVLRRSRCQTITICPLTVSLSAVTAASRPQQLPDGAVSQSAGTTTLNPGWDFTVGYGAGSTGVYSLSGTGAVVANHSEFIGLAGNGTLNHSAGSNTVTAGANHFFEIGTTAGSIGTYNLSGTGALIVNTSEYVGDAGSGFFNQTGGTNTVSGSGNNLYIGYNSGLAGLDAVYGTYTLSAGTLSVSTGTEYVGYESNPTFSTGVFNQSGGTNTAGTLVLYLGSTYALIGGVLSCNTSEYLYGWGGINQTGGTNNVANTLYIGSGSYEPIYNLGGTGSLSSVDEIIGYGTGSMIQTGGTNTVTGNLRIGAVAGYVGAYTLNAGQASINSMFVGTGTGGVGVMTVSGTGVLDVGGVLKVYKGNETSLRLYGGTINAAALDLGGTPSLLDWTSGKLNITQSVTWDSAAAVTTTSVAFGSALALSSNRTLMVTGNETLGGAGPFYLTLNAGAIHTVTGDLTINPKGTLFINGGNLNTGSLNINGAFAFRSGTLGLTGPSGLTVGTGGRLGATVSVNAGQNLNVTNTVTVNSGAYLTVAGGFSSGNLVNNGDLVVINTAIDGPVINNNKTTVVGTVNFNGPVSGPGGFFGPGTAQFNGGMAPGASPANVSFEGSLALADTNTLFVEIGGSTPGSQYDRLTITGSALIDGTLNVSIVNGFTASGGQQFTILTAGSIVNNGFVLGGSAVSSFTLLVNSTSVILQAIGLAGDYNLNGIVDAADFVVWRKGLGTTYTPDDYNVWRDHFGQTASGGSGSAAATSAQSAVPEPSSVMLLLLGLVIVGFSGRGRSSAWAEIQPSIAEVHRPMRPTATGNSAVDASVGTTWERPKQVSWRNVPVDHRF